MSSTKQLQSALRAVAQLHNSFLHPFLSSALAILFEGTAVLYIEWSVMEIEKGK
jgi:hypothetical protein